MLLESIVVSVLHCNCVYGAGSSLKRKLRKRSDLHRLKISGCYELMMFSSLPPANRKPKPIQSEEEVLSMKRMIYNRYQIVFAQQLLLFLCQKTMFLTKFHHYKTNQFKKCCPKYLCLQSSVLK